MHYSKCGGYNKGTKSKEVEDLQNALEQFMAIAEELGGKTNGGGGNGGNYGNMGNIDKMDAGWSSLVTNAD
ncbi:MAG: hypothetical protein PVSMB5_06900 [Ktedonobacteraceae bacterium]